MGLDAENKGRMLWVFRIKWIQSGPLKSFFNPFHWHTIDSLLDFVPGGTDGQGWGSDLNTLWKSFSFRMSFNAGLASALHRPTNDSSSNAGGRKQVIALGKFNNLRPKWVPRYLAAADVLHLSSWRASSSICLSDTQDNNGNTAWFVLIMLIRQPTAIQRTIYHFVDPDFNSRNLSTHGGRPRGRRPGNTLSLCFYSISIKKLAKFTAVTPPSSPVGEVQGETKRSGEICTYPCVLIYHVF